MDPHDASRKAVGDRKEKMELAGTVSRMRKPVDRIDMSSSGSRTPTGRPDKGSLQPEQLSAARKPPRPSKEKSLLHDMKPIQNQQARSEAAGASTQLPSSEGTRKTSKSDQSNSGPSRGELATFGRSKPSNPLRRKLSLRPLRPSRRVIRESTPSHRKDVEEQTCSSTLKDVAAPQKLEITRGGATAKKVCAYSRCSLNAHQQPPAPKHAFLLRKVSINGQKSFRVRGVSSPSAPRKKGLWKVEKRSDIVSPKPQWAEAAASNNQAFAGKGDSKARAKEPAAASYRQALTEKGASKAKNKESVSSNKQAVAQTRNLGARVKETASSNKQTIAEKRNSRARTQGKSLPGERKNDVTPDDKNTAAVEEIMYPDTCSSAMSFEEHHDPNSEFSDLDMDVIRTFLEAIESDGEVPTTEKRMHLKAKSSNRWLLDRNISGELNEMGMSCSEEESRPSTSELMFMEWNDEIAVSLANNGSMLPGEISKGDYQFGIQEYEHILTINEKTSNHKSPTGVNYSTESRSLIDADNMFSGTMDGEGEHVSNGAVKVSGTTSKDLPAQASDELVVDSDQGFLEIEFGLQNSTDVETAAVQGVEKDGDTKPEDIPERTVSEEDNEEASHRRLFIQAEASDELHSEKNYLLGSGNEEDSDAGNYSSGLLEADSSIPGYQEYRSLSIENRTSMNLKAEEIIKEAGECLEMDLEFQEEHLFPDVECSAEESEEDIEILLSEYLSSSHEKEQMSPIIIADEQPVPQTKHKLETRLSIKKNLIKKCIQKLRAIRVLTKTHNLSTIEEQNLQKSELRKMISNQKNTEEWMIDYKLRQLIDQLARMQKRKVELLVEAYESIMPKVTKARD